MISRRTFLELTAWAATVASGRIEVNVTRQGPLVRPRVRNRGRAPVRVNDVVVFEEALSLPADTALYGEGFQMLTQTAGTLAAPLNLSQYTDAGHYRIPTGGVSVRRP